tara:strand:+ start:27 stop:821 length:795 start_codon:yes stop_codon:yes gene_type:complete
MEDSTKEAIHNYYKLKQKYEMSIKKQKQKIMSNPSLNNEQKKQKILQIKKKCVQCNGAGGTLFTNKKNILSATCNGETPCGFNIKINRGYYTNIREEYQYLSREINNIQNKIIETKLNILFNYTSEEEAISTFDKLRKHLAGFVKAHDKVQDAYLDIIYNKKTLSEKKEVSTKIYEIVNEMKLLANNYNETNKNSFIVESIELYISQLLPILEKLQKITYVYNAVSQEESVLEDKKTFLKLEQEPYTLNELYISGSDKAEVLQI